MVWIDKMMKKRFLIVALILALLVTPIVALASDISDADYYGIIQISNNSTATTYVATTCNISTQNLIDGNYLNAEANNCVIRTSSGADVPFMPSVNATYPWCIWVPSIGENAYQSDILYTANSTGGLIRYFPGSGGMTTPDNDATLELGDNFTIEQTGWVDTSAGAGKNLVFKPSAFRTYVSGSENITSAILQEDWVTPTSVSAATWTNPNNSINDNTADYAERDLGGAGIWSGNATFTVDSCWTNTIRFWVDSSASQDLTVDLDAYYDSTWNDVSEGIEAQDGWVEKSLSGVYFVTQYRMRLKLAAGATFFARINETDILDSASELVSVTATSVSSDNHTVTTMQGTDLASWWDTDWGARKTLTFDNSACSENLTSVPVVVSLDSSNFDFSLAQADGDDLRFIDADDSTELDFFLETWEFDNEIAIARVEVPQIDALSSTDFIYTYWANDSVANNEDMNGVFTADVKLASTYKDSTDILLTDATVNDNDGDFTGAGEPDWSRLASSLQTLDFDGGNDYVNVSNHASLNITGELTIISWSVGTKVTGSARIAEKTDRANSKVHYVHGVFNENFNFAYQSPDGTWITLEADGVTVNAVSWYQFASVFDTGSIELFINGSSSKSSAGNPALLANTGALKIGTGQDAAGNNDLWWDGEIVLLRIYNRALSAEEIENKYLQEKGLFGIANGFITFGDAEYSGLRIYVDTVLRDCVGTASVPNNDNEWTFVENYSMLYLESQEIEIGGTQAQYIEWEYDTVFYDQSANSNDATPTFRTASSDADVSAELISFLPIAEAKAPDYVLGEAPPFIDSDALTGNVTGTFTTTPGAGTFPMANVIAEIATATDTPEQLPLLIIAVFIILAASLSVSAVMRQYGSGSILVKVLVIIAFMGIFIALKNFGIDFWMLVVFAIIGTSLAMASRQVGFS